MKLPQKPAACAIQLTLLLQAVHKITGENFYPIRIQDLACDISQQFFPEAPITKVSSERLSSSFEGMLFPIPRKNNQWAIIYNETIRSSGRINFTLAHELGHYLLHRLLLADGITCSRLDMMNWQSEYGQREAEANEFAAYFLMPRNLFEQQINGTEINLHLMQHIANYFDVSITAAILRWLEFTEKRAMLVVARDGFVDWARSSDSLFKSGVFLRPKQEIIELPSKSLAAQKNKFFDNEGGIHHPAGIWPFKEDVQETTLLADSYDMTISLLMFSDHAPFKEPEDFHEEVVERFNKKN